MEIKKITLKEFADMIGIEIEDDKEEEKVEEKCECWDCTADGLAEEYADKIREIERKALVEIEESIDELTKSIIETFTELNKKIANIK